MEYFYPQCNRLQRVSIGLQCELKDPNHKNKMGIYFLWFGAKYYIGSAKKLGNRCKSHELKLNKLIDEMEVGTASNYNILRHVFTDLTIEKGIMVLVYEVETEEELSEAEKGYLRDSSEDENCLNYSQEAIRPSKKKEFFLIENLRGSIIDIINECVFKLFYKDKFVIVKGKSFVGSLKNITRAIEDFSKKDKENWPQDHLYIHFIDLILSENETQPHYKVELILATNNRVELLKKEQEELWNSQSDPNCLNNAIDAYIPVWNEEKGMHGWINQGEFMAFHRWKKKNMPPQLRLANYDLSDQTDSLSPEEES